MDLKNKLIVIACNLTTEVQGKKHGSYDIYKDNKIKISYDTYYPNVEVNVFIDGESKLAASYCGGGGIAEFHEGSWENYVENTLYPHAEEARKEKELKRELKRREEESIKSAPLNDKAVFAD